MKLMVVEMQQQLNELEDREKSGGGDGADGGGSDPKPPPRGRANPFNSGAEVGCGCTDEGYKPNQIFIRERR